MSRKDDYVQALKYDTDDARAYYLKSFEIKTEQQKMLEGLIKGTGQSFPKVADIACGSGSLSYHLSEYLTQSEFTLVDFNEQALGIAAGYFKGRFEIIQDDIYVLGKLQSSQFDLTLCWQTLSWLNDPETALNQLLRITKPGGRIYLSSLFNLEHEVDVYSKVIDHTRPSSAANLSYNYNTYSSKTILSWIGAKATEIKFHPFHPTIDFEYNGKGIGTYTLRDESGKRLQLSAGMLLNWYILEIVKSND